MRRKLFSIATVVLMLSFAGVAGAATTQKKQASGVKRLMVWLQGKLIIPWPTTEEQGKLILPHPTQGS
ncbi:MAG TPA: hypothetical protein VGF48_06510 [Thermoanaerobaculia bacterium]|jgi:hypothetical protein